MSAELDIQKTICRFANSFDLKDWTLMKTTLAPKLLVDYTDLRGEPAQEITAETYISRRKKALQTLNTHHLIGNFDIEISGDTAAVTAGSMIYRRDGVRTFNTHAIYQFRLVDTKQGEWRIEQIKQVVLWNEGDSLIHAGVNRAGSG